MGLCAKAVGKWKLGGQSLTGPLDSEALSLSEEEDLFWKEKKIFQGQPFCSEQNIICE